LINLITSINTYLGLLFFLYLLNYFLAVTITIGIVSDPIIMLPSHCHSCPLLVFQRIICRSRYTGDYFDRVIDAKVWYIDCYWFHSAGRWTSCVVFSRPYYLQCLRPPTVCLSSVCDVCIEPKRCVLEQSYSL